MKRLTIILSLLSVVGFTSCEDDPLLEEQITSEETGGSYGKTNFVDVEYYEDILEDQKND
ncbi:hypothetical protein N9V83_03165 [Flavobacteriales bacterium]|jgi:hypothetical protein|nr:hypothetical protein [Flavobacteriales bacterium]